MNVSTASKAPPEPAMKRRHCPLTAAAEGRRGIPSRPVARWGRGFPGLASTTSTSSTTFSPCEISRFTPVPTPAHGTIRAIRVRRSPR
jgi:hypothetical protein